MCLDFFFFIKQFTEAAPRRWKKYFIENEIDRLDHSVAADNKNVMYINLKQIFAVTFLSG